MSKVAKKESTSKKSKNAGKAQQAVMEFVNEGKKVEKKAEPTIQVAWSSIAGVMHTRGLKRSMQPWVFDAITSHGQVTIAELCKNLSINERRAGRIVRALEKHGLIVRSPADAKLDKATFGLADGIKKSEAHDVYEQKIKDNAGRGLKAYAGEEEELAVAE